MSLGSNEDIRALWTAAENEAGELKTVLSQLVNARDQVNYRRNFSGKSAGKLFSRVNHTISEKNMELKDANDKIEVARKREGRACRSRIIVEKQVYDNVQIIDLLGVMAEYRNQESGEHIQRIKGYTRIMAEEVMKEFPEKGLTPELVNVIVSASSLHDIGKIVIPDTILLKPGKLTEKEFDYMKSHTISGCEILENLKDAWSKEYGSTSMEICRHHHERYDGNGYPDGLAGDEIPLSAQIVAVADVYDALTHERVYKAAIPKDVSYQMIMNGECGAFSPEMLQCLTNCREKMEAL